MSPTSMSTARSTRPSSASASPISRTKTCSSRTRLPRPTGISRTRTRVRGRRNSTSVPSRKNSDALTLVCRPDNLAAAPMYRGSGGCSAGASRLVRRRLARADEGAGEFAINVRCDLLRIEIGPCKDVSGIRNRVDTRRLYVNFGEAGARELCTVLGLLERSGDASDPEFDAAADFGGHFTAHVDAAARTQVEHRFAGLQLRECRGIAASQGGRDRCRGQIRLIAVGVEVTGYRIGASASAGGRAATGRTTLIVEDPQGSFAVVFPDFLFD